MGVTFIRAITYRVVHSDSQRPRPLIDTFRNEDEKYIIKNT